MHSVKYVLEPALCGASVHHAKVFVHEQLLCKVSMSIGVTWNEGDTLIYSLEMTMHHQGRGKVVLVGATSNE